MPSWCHCSRVHAPSEISFTALSTKEREQNLRQDWKTYHCGGEDQFVERSLSPLQAPLKVLTCRDFLALIITPQLHRFQPERNAPDQGCVLPPLAMPSAIPRHGRSKLPSSPQPLESSPGGSRPPSPRGQRAPAGLGGVNPRSTPRPRRERRSWAAGARDTTADGSTPSAPSAGSTGSDLVASITVATAGAGGTGTSAAGSSGPDIHRSSSAGRAELLPPKGMGPSEFAAAWGWTDTSGTAEASTSPPSSCVVRCAAALGSVDTLAPCSPVCALLGCIAGSTTTSRVRGAPTSCSPASAVGVLAASGAACPLTAPPTTYVGGGTTTSGTTAASSAPLLAYSGSNAGGRVAGRGPTGSSRAARLTSFYDAMLSASCWRGYHEEQIMRWAKINGG
jgi:hypothetical protein